MQLQVGSNELGYDEVVDTLGDVLDVTDAFENALSDGIDPTDLFVIVNNYPKLKEIGTDLPVFWAQLKDLTPAESDAVYKELSERRGEDLNSIAGKVSAGLRRVVRTYRFGYYVLGEGQAILEDWKDFFAELKPGQDGEAYVV